MENPIATVDLSDTKTEVRVRYRGIETRHFFREPTPEEWIDYRRRTSRYQFRHGRAEATDEAAKAPLWLYKKIAEKADGFSVNGSGLMQFEDWRERIPIQVAEAAINAYLLQVESSEGPDSN